MELCTGSSLYEVIDSPDNAYGLSETEFKQVIYDVGTYVCVRIIEPVSCLFSLERKTTGSRIHAPPLCNRVVQSEYAPEMIL